MNTFLNRLVSRSLDRAASVQPRIPSLFEPIGGSLFTERMFSAVTDAPDGEARDVTGASAQPVWVPMQDEWSSPSAGPPQNRKETPDFAITRAPAKKTEFTQAATVKFRPSAEGARTGNEPASVPVITRAAARAPIARSDNESPVADAMSHQNPVGNLGPIKPVSRVFNEPKPTAQVPRQVQVTIGRVEVRAVLPAPAAPGRISKPAPGLSLERYLTRRNGRKV